MHRYQTISRLRYNTKPSGSESQQRWRWRWRWREVKPAVCRQQQQFAAVIRFSTFHICIQIQKLQMAIEPFLNQYVICWLGEGPYTSWPLAVWYIALYWKQCNECKVVENVTIKCKRRKAVQYLDIISDNASFANALSDVEPHQHLSGHESVP